MDLLVKLYDLPDDNGLYKKLEGKDIVLRRPKAYEKSIVLGWIKENFSTYWMDETDAAFSSAPISAFIAHREKEILGFAAYNATAKGFFGPIGVGESHRGKGLGFALTLRCLQAMYEDGYAYAIIGGGLIDFYVKTVGAIPIEGSEPGIYKGML